MLLKKCLDNYLKIFCKTKKINMFTEWTHKYAYKIKHFKMYFINVYMLRIF